MTETAIKRYFVCPSCGAAVWTEQEAMWCCNVKHTFPGVAFPTPTVNVKPKRDPVRKPCLHLGKELRKDECPSCTGHTKVSVHHCNLYKECTHQKNTGMACCISCGSYATAAPKDSPELIEDINGPYVPRAVGWELRPEVVNSHKILLNEEAVKVRELKMPLAAEPMSMVGESSDGRGIVISGGGSKYFTCAYVLVSLLRKMGCTLPIEWWYLNHYEMDLQMMRIAESFGNVEVVSLKHRLDYVQRTPRMMGGWHSKVWSIMYSKFREVLYIDADQIPQKDPTYLFDMDQYQEHGAVFWPDYPPMGWSVSRTAFETAGLPVPGNKTNRKWQTPTDYTPFESGQVLVDKARHWPALELTRYINDHSDFWYAQTAHDRHQWHVYGDKDTFFLAWNKLKAPHVVAPPCYFVGDSSAGAFIQHDFEGEEVFQHRVQPTSKWSLHGRNKSFPGCTKHEECQEILNGLRYLWIGHPYDFRQEGEKEKEIAIKTRGRKLWFRKDDGQKELELCPNGETSDGRYHWTVRMFDGKPTMVIADWCRVLAFMGQDQCGNWVNHQTGNFLVEAPPVGFDIPQQPDEVALYHEIVNLNEYNLPEQFENEDVIVDIGAHCGIFTTLCLGKGAGRVVAVEPHPENYARLRNNTKHVYAGRVNLIAVAAWRCGQEPGDIFIAQPQGALHSGGWSAVGTMSGLSVHTVPFDVIIKLSAPVRLVKLDCEGCEWCILETFQDWHLVKGWCGEYHHNTVEEATERLEKIFRPNYSNLRVTPNPNSNLLGHFWAW